MSDIIVFGDKTNFAIQLGLHTNVERCKLCFYIQGKKMGSFTKGGELKYSVKAYRAFTSNKEMYYDPAFDKMTPTGIRKYFIDEMFALLKSNKKEKQDEYERRKKMEFFWGAQFTNDGSDIFLFYKESKVKFIYAPPKKTTADEYKVDYSFFCKVFDEYIEYTIKNKLI